MLYYVSCICICICILDILYILHIHSMQYIVHSFTVQYSHITSAYLNEARLAWLRSFIVVVYNMYNVR